MAINRRTTFKLFGSALLLAGASGSLFAQSQEVVFGATLPLSGPFAAVAKDQLEGMKDYFDFVNAKGGVRGKRFALLPKTLSTRSIRLLQLGRNLWHLTILSLFLGMALGLFVLPLRKTMTDIRS